MTGRPVWVLHRHERPRLHHDLRLEERGVLRSWALPKGLPTDWRRDRLAVAVADHALEHATYGSDWLCHLLKDQPASPPPTPEGSGPTALRQPK